LYAPVQRLPRVLLLIQRLKKLNPTVKECETVLDYVKEMLNDFEEA
jgi:hypothetical protein